MKKTGVITVLSDGTVMQDYNVSDIPLYIARGKLRPGGNTISEHANLDLETIYVSEGEMTAQINGKDVHVLEKEILVINSSIPHSLRCGGDKDCIYSCGIANESLFTASRFMREKYIDQIFYSFNHDYILIKRNSPYYEPIEKVFSEIWNIYDKQPRCYELLITAKLQEYLAYLYMYLGDSDLIIDSNLEKKDYRLFLRMVEHVRYTMAEKISIKGMADAAGVSEKTVHNLFRKYANRTPFEFVTFLRINAAKNLLVDGSYTLSDIALMTGFSHQSHFTKVFKSETGVTPREYVKSIVK